MAVCRLHYGTDQLQVALAWGVYVGQGVVEHFVTVYGCTLAEIWEDEQICYYFRFCDIHGVGYISIDWDSVWLLQSVQPTIHYACAGMRLSPLCPVIAGDVRGIANTL